MYRDEFAGQAYKLCLLMNADDSQLADYFEVSEQTITAWKRKHPEFLASVRRGKVPADADMAASLYARGRGYAHEVTRLFVIEGEIVEKKIIERYPPDTHAAMMWLKNRQPKQFRDQPPAAEATGQDDGLKELAAAILASPA